MSMEQDAAIYAYIQQLQCEGVESNVANLAAWAGWSEREVRSSLSSLQSSEMIRMRGNVVTWVYRKDGGAA